MRRRNKPRGKARRRKRRKRRKLSFKAFVSVAGAYKDTKGTQKRELPGLLRLGQGT